MGVGDERAGDRAHRVDMKAAGRAEEPFGSGDEEVGAAHGM
jgi:hypothetical protein